MALKNDKWQVKASDLFMAVAAGMAFGIFNFILVFVLGGIWVSLENWMIDGIRFYHSFGSLPGGHIIIEGLCLVILCGLYFGYLSRKRGYDSRVTLLLGGLAGFTLSLFPFSPSWTIIWSSPAFLQLDNRVKIPCIMAAGLIICVPLAALSAYTYWQTTDGRRPVPENKKLLVFVALATIVVLVIPPLIAMTGLTMGWIEGYPDMYTINWPVKVERTADDTIVITNPGYQTRSGIDLGDYLDAGTPFTININGKNASNDAAINSSGLQLAISRESGLGRQSGQTVSFTGPDVSTINDTNVRVIRNYRDGGQMFAYTGRV
jgi:hypothetical protein